MLVWVVRAACIPLPPNPVIRNCLDDDLASFPSFRFLFRELKNPLKIAFCTRVSAIFYFFDFNVLYNPRKIIFYADPLLNAKCGWLLAGISYAKALRQVAQYFKSAFPSSGMSARNQHWPQNECRVDGAYKSLIFIVYLLAVEGRDWVVRDRTCSMQLTVKITSQLEDVAWVSRLFPFAARFNKQIFF